MPVHSHALFNCSVHPHHACKHHGRYSAEERPPTSTEKQNQSDDNRKDERVLVSLSHMHRGLYCSRLCAHHHHIVAALLHLHGAEQSVTI